MNIESIAHIHTPFAEKFGIPRQSNIIDGITSTIVFEPHYRNADALRGIEGFDYLWLIWRFNASERDEWTPTVRPPRLGGNQRMGVFATRSPFRPNSLGLSSVRLVGVDIDNADGPRLFVAGADLLDGTPIIDIKPYLPYTDSHPDARSGFAPLPATRLLEVSCPPHLLALISEPLRQPLLDILAHDPRPSYHNSNDRIYGMTFDKKNIRFKVLENRKLEIISINF